MAFRGVKVLLIACIGLVLVDAQDDGQYRPNGDDGRYRPSDEGKYSGTDGKYFYQDKKYVNTKEKGGSSGPPRYGGGPVINIGGNRPAPRPAKIPATPKITTAIPTTPRPTTRPTQSPPPIFVIDTRPNSFNFNQDGSPSAEANVKIVRQEQEETADGYRYLFETENGILAEQTGQIEKSETGDDILQATGFYQYVGDDGKQYRVDYVADINGFSPKGEHLPTPPPIPPQIQELLNILATKPPDSN